MAYKDVIIADSPVSYWTLDPDFSILDEIAGLSLTPRNTPGTTVGPDGVLSAIDLDGTNEYYDRSSYTAINITGAVSVEAWVRIDDTVQFDVIFAKGKTSVASTDSAASPFALFMASSGFRFHIAKTSGGARTDVVTAPFSGEDTDGLWHYLCGSWNGTTGTDNLKLTVDDTLRGTASPAVITALKTTGDDVNVGRDPVRAADTRMYWGGGIAHLAIYDYELSEADKLAHYNAMSGGGPVTNPFNPLLLKQF